MKKIKKIAAGLMAAAIAAAGMGSLTASATLRMKPIYLPTGETAMASLDYTLRQRYYAETKGTCSGYKAVRVYAEGMWNNVTLWGYGYDNRPAWAEVVPIGNTYSIGYINYFYSSHSATTTGANGLGSTYFEIRS
ncbi:MAG: hypothetical protein IJL32_08960 [Oscillospiraceae bacterium]|nr:hypothetical protein [Oscillospiraceae bacterium]